MILRADARHLPLDDASVDAIVCDPPYELGFMGKTWDTSGVAYRVETWAEALRVLKPGGHLLAFGGTRTHHRLTVAIEDAGFEIRDVLMWLYGSGFPKSLDVSKAIDRQRDDREQVLQVTRWIADARDAAGLTNGALDAAFGFAGMAGHWTSQQSQPAVPTLDQIPTLLDVLGDPDVPPEIERLILDLNGRKGQPGDNWFRREITQKESRPLDSGDVISFDQRSSTERERRDIPATDAARQWEGWGTALKPAYEPIVLARKPLVGTVAANVLAHGTGALNIDGTRIGTTDNLNGGAYSGGGRSGLAGDEREGAAAGMFADGGGRLPGQYDQPPGRWPANLLLDEEAAALVGEPARYFYTAKASRTEREAGLDDLEPLRRSDGREKDIENPRLRTSERRNHHPTVKPVALMRWLVTLVTPPGGTVLDPFMGSGSTGIAATELGFKFIGSDLDESYIEIARRRIAHVTAPRMPL